MRIVEYADAKEVADRADMKARRWIQLDLIVLDYGAVRIATATFG